MGIVLFHLYNSVFLNHTFSSTVTGETSLVLIAGFNPS